MDECYSFGENSQYKISLESMDYALLPINKLIDKYRSKETCIKMNIFDVENEPKVKTKEESNDLQSYYEYEIERIVNYTDNLKESETLNNEDAEDFKHKTEHCYICRINIPKEHFNIHIANSLHKLNLKIVQDSVNRLNERMIHELNHTHHDLTTELDNVTTATTHDIMTIENASKIQNTKNLDTPLFCSICNESYLLPFHDYSQKHSINTTKLKLLENFTNFYLEKHFGHQNNKQTPKRRMSYNVQHLKDMKYVQPQKQNQEIDVIPKRKVQQQLTVQPLTTNQSSKILEPPTNALLPNKIIKLVKKVQPEKKLHLPKSVPQQNNALTTNNLQPKINVQPQNNVQSPQNNMQSHQNMQPQKNVQQQNSVQLQKNLSDKSLKIDAKQNCLTLNTADSSEDWLDALSFVRCDSSHETTTPEQLNGEDEEEFLRLIGTAQITKNPKGYFCHHCAVPVPANLKNLSCHLKGKPHKSKITVAISTPSPSTTTLQEIVAKKGKNVTYNKENQCFCDICNVKVPKNHSNIIEHITGSAHIKNRNNKNVNQQLI